MKKRFNRYVNKHYLPRGIILSFDISVIAVSLFMAHLLANRLNFSFSESDYILWQLAFTLPVYLLGIIFFRPFTDVIRHSTLESTLKIFFALTFSAGFLIMAGFFISYTSVLFIPLTIIILQYLISFGMILVSRLLIRSVYHTFFRFQQIDKNIVIYGAGSLGQMAYKVIINNRELKARVVAFIDDNKSLHNKCIFDVPVYSMDKAFQSIFAEKKVSELIIAISQPKLHKSNKRKVIDLCIEKGIHVKEVPRVSKWINGGLNANKFRKINIEDLLGRDSVQLDRNKIREGLKNATVLITGAAGSIGSEIARQLIAFKAKEVILLDNAESPLYNLQNEIIIANNNPVFKILIGDVTNKQQLRKIFEKYSPSIVFNAAAYKHVPLMEEFPCEAIRVNVGGTKNLADLSIEFGVKKFVFISTDKAVNPTNVMGATKRISEIYIQSIAQNDGIATQFITTRFGNVLGSNGSVVPLFKKQIEAGGPVTLTHKDICRYFMTIPEASQLVLEAGFMGNGGEIFVFDMGEPIKIYDLAKKMIALSGLVADKDIEIKIIGLRPGEKLYEELLNNKEQVLPTYNDKIMIAKIEEHDYEEVNYAVSRIIESVDELSKHDLIACMKDIVPEFTSMNSEYYRLYKNSKPPASSKMRSKELKVLIN